MADGQDKLLPVATDDSAALGELLERAQTDYEAGTVDNTERAYRGDWNRWEAWCAARGLVPAPVQPAALYAYASSLADDGKKASTIDRAIAGISYHVEMRGHPRPVFDKRLGRLMKGVRKRAGRRVRPMTPLLPQDLAAVFPEMPVRQTRPARDRALLSVGLAGAFRRSELVAIDVEHLSWSSEGVRVYVPTSKTDKEDEGAWVGIEPGDHEETCPVVNLERWLDLEGIHEGPVFRRLTRLDNVLDARAADNTVNRVVRAVAEAVGHDPTEYGGHSLRAGYATAAAAVGKPLEVIMRHGRWRRVETVLRYIRPVAVFADNPTKGIGL
jgi:integrase